MNKEEFLLIKISELCYKFKTCATLAILAINKKDTEAVKNIHNNLIKLYNKMLDKVKTIYDNKMVYHIENNELNKLPKELNCIRIVDTYKKFLSYEYLNIQSDNLEDNVFLNKMSIEFNPLDDIPFINLGQLFLKEKKYNEALSIIEYLKTVTETAPLYSLAGDTYRALGKYGEAIENYLHYLDINSKDEEFIEKLNQTYEEILS